MGETEIETVGIVLRRFDYGDTSQIAHLITPNLGRVAVLAKAIKRPNPYLKGPFDLFQMAKIVYRPGRGSDLGLLKRYEPMTGFSGLRTSLPAIYGAFYLVDLAWELAREDVGDMPSFQLLARALSALEGSSAPRASAIVFATELGLLEAMGMAPALETCARCGRPAEAQPLAVFPQAGGYFCSACPKPKSPAFALVPGDLRLLTALHRASPSHASKLGITGEQHLRLRRILSAIIQTALDRELKSERFVRNPRRGFLLPSAPSGKLSLGAEPR